MNQQSTTEGRPNPKRLTRRARHMRTSSEISKLTRSATRGSPRIGDPLLHLRISLAWGKGLLSLQELAAQLVAKDKDHVKDFCIPPSALVMKIPDTLPKVWNSSSKQVLVCSEYHKQNKRLCW